MVPTPTVDLGRLENISRRDFFLENTLALSVIDNQMRFLELEEQDSESYELLQFISHNFFNICNRLSSTGREFQSKSTPPVPQSVALFSAKLERLATQNWRTTSWKSYFPMEYQSLLEELLMECERQGLLIIKVNGIEITQYLKTLEKPVKLRMTSYPSPGVWKDFKPHLTSLFPSLNTQILDELMPHLGLAAITFGVLLALSLVILIVSLYFHLCSFWLIGFLPYAFFCLVISFWMSDAWGFYQFSRADEFMSSEDHRMIVFLALTLSTFFLNPPSSTSHALFTLASWTASCSFFMFETFLALLTVTAASETSPFHCLTLITLTIVGGLLLPFIFCIPSAYFYLCSITVLGVVPYGSLCMVIGHFLPNFRLYILVLSFIAFFFFPFFHISSFLFQVALFIASNSIYPLTALLSALVFVGILHGPPDSTHPDFFLALSTMTVCFPLAVFVTLLLTSILFYIFSIKTLGITLYGLLCFLLSSQVSDAWEEHHRKWNVSRNVVKFLRVPELRIGLLFVLSFPTFFLIPSFPISCSLFQMVVWMAYNSIYILGAFFCFLIVAALSKHLSNALPLVFQ